eukprot:scaffold260_cov328-Prasinococcus_capsulatus_cf.AAC.12
MCQKPEVPEALGMGDAKPGSEDHDGDKAAKQQAFLAQATLKPVARTNTKVPAPDAKVAGVKEDARTTRRAAIGAEIELRPVRDGRATVTDLGAGAACSGLQVEGRQLAPVRLLLADDALLGVRQAPRAGAGGHADAVRAPLRGQHSRCAAKRAHGTARGGLADGMAAAAGACRRIADFQQRWQHERASKAEAKERRRAELQRRGVPVPPEPADRAASPPATSSAAVAAAGKDRGAPKQQQQQEDAKKTKNARKKKEKKHPLASYVPSLWSVCVGWDRSLLLLSGMLYGINQVRRLVTSATAAAAATASVADWRTDTGCGARALAFAPRRRVGARHGDRRARSRGPCCYA